MTEFLAMVAFVVGLVVGYIVINRRSRSKFLASSEFWVYLPTDKMPNQSQVMDRMLNENPFRVRGASPIGKNEGLVFSDVRLHIALVLRQKNPHVFRPDLFTDAHLPDAETLQRLSSAQSFVKLRYVSEQPLPDKRHLRFLVHAAAAYADLGDGLVIYDSAAERLYAPEEFSAALQANPDGTSSAFHVRVHWVDDPTGNRAETRGLAKIGLDELIAPAVRADERVLIGNVLMESVEKLWGDVAVPETQAIDCFDDQFRLHFRPLPNRRTEVRILRIQNS